MFAMAATFVVAGVAFLSSPGAAQDGVTFSLSVNGTADSYWVDALVNDEYYLPELPWTEVFPPGADFTAWVLEVGDISCTGDTASLSVVRGDESTSIEGVLPASGAVIDCVFTEQPGLNDVPFSLTNTSDATVSADLFIGLGAFQATPLAPGETWNTAVRSGPQLEVRVDRLGAITCTGDAGAFDDSIRFGSTYISGVLPDPVTAVACAFGPAAAPTPTPVPPTPVPPTPPAIPGSIPLTLTASGTADIYLAEVLADDDFYAPELPWTGFVAPGASITAAVLGVGDVSCTGDGGSLAIERLADFTRIVGQLPGDAASVECGFVEQAGINNVPFSLTVDSDSSVSAQLRLDFGAIQRRELLPGETWSSAVRASIPLELVVGQPGELVCEGDGGSLTYRSSQVSTSFSGELGEVAARLDCTFTQGLVPTPTPTPLAPVPTATPTPSPVDLAASVYPTVTCLGGNGRIDINVVNPSGIATYRLEVGGLSPREHDVGARDWWRTPITGRPDGPIAAQVWRDGVLIFDEVLTVACDAEPTVTEPEAQHMVACRPLGFVVWQFANPTDAPRSYIIEFDGVPTRSTTAEAHGAAVRGVSGRPNGTYGYQVTADGTIIDQGTATIAC